MKLKRKVNLIIENQFGNERIVEIEEVIYLSTNSDNPFISVMPVYNEKGIQDGDYCKVLHREAGELIVKGGISILGKKFIEEKEIKDSKIVGYGKNKVK